MSHRSPDTQRTSEIEKYIKDLNETLEKVFHTPPEQRREIVSSLRKEGKNYWDVTLHYLPLYSAANLMRIQVCYPDFDKYEDRYSKLIEDQT